MHMGVGLAILTETKLMNDRYTRLASGFKILPSKTTSHNQGGLPCCGKRITRDMRWNRHKLLHQTSSRSNSLLVKSDSIVWEYTPPPPTRWGRKIFVLLGKPVQRAVPGPEY